MAGVTVAIDVDDAEIQKAVRKLIANAARARPAFDEIGSMLLASTQQRFEDESGPDGEPWPALAKSTTEALLGDPGSKGRRKRGSANMLRVSGLLYQSITYAATDREAEVGTNRVYAALQQLGGTPEMKNAGARAVPARPYLGLSSEDRDEALHILTQHLMKGV